MTLAIVLYWHCICQKEKKNLPNIMTTANAFFDDLLSLFIHKQWLHTQPANKSGSIFSTCTALGKRGLDAADCVAGTAGLLAIPGAVTGAAGAIGGMPGLATRGGIPKNKKMINYHNRLTSIFFLLKLK